MILKLLLAINILSVGPPLIDQQNSVNPPLPEIISINTDYQKDGVWVRIPKGTEKVTFRVKAENTETILFWLIPTGTQTWTERKLIGYDIRENEADKSFSLTWSIDKPSLHDHLHIQAIGGETVTNDFINLYME